MKYILHAFISKLLPSVLAIAFVGVTLVTSGMAGMKLIQAKGVDSSDKFNSTAVPTLEALEPSLIITPVQSPPPGSSIPNSKNIALVIPTTKPSTKTPASAALTNSPVATAQQATNPNACIVTLFGKQYDVTTLRSTHSGGNIFSCGTDMTTVYQNRHGTDMSRMQQYLVSTAPSQTGGSSQTATGTTGSGGITSSPTSSPSHSSIDQDDDDDESDDHYIEQEKDEHNEQKQEHPLTTQGESEHEDREE